MSTKNKVQLVILGVLLLLSVSSLVFFMNSNTAQCYNAPRMLGKVVTAEQMVSKDAYFYITKSHLSCAHFTIAISEKLFNTMLSGVTNSKTNSHSLMNHTFRFYCFSFTPFVTKCFKYTL